MSAGLRLAQDVVHGVLAFRFRSQHEGFAEANLFELLHRDTVAADMGDPILGPDELRDLHSRILPGCFRTSVQLPTEWTAMALHAAIAGDLARSLA